MKLESVVLAKERIAGYSLILTKLAPLLRKGDSLRRNAEFHLDQGILHGKREWKKDSSSKTREHTDYIQAFSMKSSIHLHTFAHERLTEENEIQR